MIENLPERKEKFTEHAEQCMDILLLDEFRKYVEEYRRYPKNEKGEVDLDEFWKSEAQLQDEVKVKIQKAINDGIVKKSYKFGGIGIEKTEKGPIEIISEQPERQEPKLLKEAEQPEGKLGIDDAMGGGIRRGEVIETTHALNNAIRNQENELNQENTNEQGDRN